MLFSKSKNREWVEKGFANTPLGLYLDIDLEVVSVNMVPEQPWHGRFERGEIARPECEGNEFFHRHCPGVAVEIRHEYRGLGSEVIHELTTGTTGARGASGVGYDGDLDQLRLSLVEGGADGEALGTDCQPIR